MIRSDISPRKKDSKMRVSLPRVVQKSFLIRQLSNPNCKRLSSDTSNDDDVWSSTVSSDVSTISDNDSTCCESFQRVPLKHPIHGGRPIQPVGFKTATTAGESGPLSRSVVSDDDPFGRDNFDSVPLKHPIHGGRPIQPSGLTTSTMANRICPLPRHPKSNTQMPLRKKSSSRDQSTKSLTFEDLLHLESLSSRRRDDGTLLGKRPRHVKNRSSAASAALSFPVVGYVNESQQRTVEYALQVVPATLGECHESLSKVWDDGPREASSQDGGCDETHPLFRSGDNSFAFFEECEYTHQSKQGHKQAISDAMSSSSIPYSEMMLWDESNGYDGDESVEFHKEISQRRRQHPLIRDVKEFKKTITSPVRVLRKSNSKALERSKGWLT